MKTEINRKNAGNIGLTGRTIFAALSLTLVFLVGALTASAQHGYRVTKRVTFKKGEVQTFLKGTIPNTLEGHEYVFYAREGQTLKTGIYCPKQEIGFFILTPGGDMIDEETAMKSWAGELPETGDYHIIINTQTKGVARYTLEIQIATDI